VVFLASPRSGRLATVTKAVYFVICYAEGSEIEHYIVDGCSVTHVFQDFVIELSVAQPQLPRRSALNVIAALNSRVRFQCCMKLEVVSVCLRITCKKPQAPCRRLLLRKKVCSTFFVAVLKPLALRYGLLENAPNADC